MRKASKNELLNNLLLSIYLCFTYFVFVIKCGKMDSHESLLQWRQTLYFYVKIIRYYLKKLKENTVNSTMVQVAIVSATERGENL